MTTIEQIVSCLESAQGTMRCLPQFDDGPLGRDIQNALDAYHSEQAERAKPVEYRRFGVGDEFCGGVIRVISTLNAFPPSQRDIVTVKMSQEMLAKVLSALDLIEEVEHAMKHPLTPICPPLSRLKILIERFKAGSYTIPEKEGG